MEKQYIDVSKICGADSMFFMEALLELIANTRMIFDGDLTEDEALAAASDYEDTLNTILDRCMVASH